MNFNSINHLWLPLVSSRNIAVRWGGGRFDLGIEGGKGEGDGEGDGDEDGNGVLWCRVVVCELLRACVCVFGK